MKNILYVVFALGMLMSSANSAIGASIVTPGLTVSSGDLIFSNFTCAFTGSGVNTGTCASIGVAGLTPEPSGLQFFTILSVSGISTADAALTFSVSAPDGVNAVGLSFASAFAGLEINSVSEDVFSSLGGNLAGSAVVYCGQITGCDDTTTETIPLDGTYTSLYITKDVNLSSFQANGPGTDNVVRFSNGVVTSITQTFVATPEPPSTVLLLIGAIAALSSTPALYKRCFTKAAKAYATPQTAKIAPPK